MTEETRERAIKALKHTRAAGNTEWYFPVVFVVGTHIFFTFMAAVRMRNTIRIHEGRYLAIEKVECPTDYPVNTHSDQKGELMPGEVFPSKEYAQLINS